VAYAAVVEDEGGVRLVVGRSVEKWERLTCHACEGAEAHYPLLSC